MCYWITIDKPPVGNLSWLMVLLLLVSACICYVLHYEYIYLLKIASSWTEWSRFCDWMMCAIRTERCSFTRLKCSSAFIFSEPEWSENERTRERSERWEKLERSVFGERRWVRRTNPSERLATGCLRGAMNGVGTEWMVAEQRVGVSKRRPERWARFCPERWEQVAYVKRNARAR